nr:hypothetical protein Iba_scaffold1680065CG0010 [Ipomoea batatas]
MERKAGSLYNLDFASRFASRRSIMVITCIENGVVVIVMPAGWVARILCGLLSPFSVSALPALENSPSWTNERSTLPCCWKMCSKVSLYSHASVKMLTAASPSRSRAASISDFTSFCKYRNSSSKNAIARCKTVLIRFSEGVRSGNSANPSLSFANLLTASTKRGTSSSLPVRSRHSPADLYSATLDSITSKKRSTTSGISGGLDLFSTLERIAAKRSTSWNNRSKFSSPLPLDASPLRFPLSCMAYNSPVENE